MTLLSVLVCMYAWPGRARIVTAGVCGAPLSGALPTGARAAERPASAPSTGLGAAPAAPAPNKAKTTGTMVNGAIIRNIRLRMKSPVALAEASKARDAAGDQ